MAMAVPSGAQDEIALVERAFLRIGSTDSDEQLENALSKFLPPILLKLSSSQEGVRKKVMEVLIHVNKRVKSRSAVKLPVDTLLLQYQDPAATSFLKNFTIIYIKLGFPRLEPARQVELAIPMLLSMEGSPQSHQDSILWLVVGVMGNSEFSDKRAQADIAALKEKPAMLSLLLDFMLDVLLLPYGVTWPPPPAADGSAVPPPPGLSERAVRRVLGDPPLPAERLERLKAGLVRFLVGSQLPAASVAPHLLVAQADTRFSVANLAGMELKRLSDLDWEDTALVKKLCDIYVGTLVPKDRAAAAPAQELRRTPVSTRIRLKLLPYLSRSRAAATMFPQAVQVMFDSFYGSNTNVKLKLLALHFTTHFINNSPEVRLAPLGGMILGVLQSMLSPEQTDLKLRAAAYSSVGQLGQKLPDVISKDFTIIQMFFKALEEEPPESVQYVQDALLLLAPALRRAAAAAAAAPAQAMALRHLVAAALQRPPARVRQVAVQYAAMVFPETEAAARLQLLLATADSKEEVASEALKHLRLSEREEPEAGRCRQFPDFTAMVDCVAASAAEREAKRLGVSVGNTVLPFPPKAFDMIVRYLSLCLQRRAAPGRPVSLELRRGRAVGLSAALTAPELAPPLRQFVALAVRLLRADVSEAALFCLLETVAAAPVLLTPLLADKLDWLKSLVSYPREPVRVYAAELYGVVAAAGLEDSHFTACLNAMHGLATSKVLEPQQGGMLALAHCLSRRSRLGRPPARDDPHVIQLAADVLSQLTSTQAALLGACYDSVAELGRTGPLPAAAGPADQAAPPSAHYVVTQLMKAATNKDLASKSRERAVVACGCVCAGDPALPFRRDIVQHFLSVSKELGELELQMAVGETLVCAVLGPQSPEARDPWLTAEENDVATPPPAAQHYQPDELLSWLLRQLLENQLTQTHPKARQSAGVWLLAMVKHCHHLKPLKDNLAAIQSAFMELLASGNDLVQEAASKGLALVYDSGDEQQRQQLVDGLVGALTGARSSTQKVTADTKLFAEGELGSDPSGGQLSTYKELCSLASDLNQPDLVYKFMQLSNHNAAWNSRRGAAFGFSSIAARAGQALTPHLGKIVPKLYRYQYDPKPQVQQTMRAIWAAIVPETTKTVTRHLPQITDEVIDHLTDGQWRVRESCCAALAELLTGGGGALEPILHRLPDMWTTLFRVRDDIKESVRVAAAKTLEVLGRVSVRLCEQQDAPKASAQTMELVLPVLLETGLNSTVAEVRAISLSTVMSLARSAGSRLRPQLPKLVPALLEALSGLESSSARYISTATAQRADAQQTVDRLRLSAAKDSAMFRTLSQCIQYVDGEEAAQIAPRLSELMKRNTGLATKCGVALFSARLAAERPLALQQSAGKVLSALVHGMQDRNLTVRRTAASACGAVCRTARPASVQKLIAKLRGWYMEGEDESLRPVCAQALQSLAQHAPTQLKEHAADAASLAFFAMHRAKSPETEEELAQWEEVWSELTPGTEGGLRLYLEEIVPLCRAGLDGQSWPVKAQAAAALGRAAAALGSALAGPQLETMLEALLTALPGRTWDGKQALLAALADVCQNCAAALPQPAPLAEAVLRETRREQAPYRAHAVTAAGRVLHHLKLDRFAELYQTVAPFIEESQGKGDAQEKDDDEEADREARFQLQEAAYTALGRAWPDNPQTQAALWSRYLAALLAALPRSPRSHQSAIVASLRPVVASLWLFRSPALDDQPLLTEAANQLGGLLATALEIPKFPSLRREALAVTSAMLSAISDLRQKQQFPVLPAVGALSVRLTAALELARADSHHDIQAEAVDASALLCQLAQ